jgi:hypothetical protein
MPTYRRIWLTLNVFEFVNKHIPQISFENQEMVKEQEESDLKIKCIHLRSSTAFAKFLSF